MRCWTIFLARLVLDVTVQDGVREAGTQDITEQEGKVFPRLGGGGGVGLVQTLATAQGRHKAYPL
ncbi:MAG: hypothetical protein EA399_05935 [Desulfovibrionales bacterium]|nr:MAG: hypothetical protein EA399_05935 [Desulfovibrionales bacterium]